MLWPGLSRQLALPVYNWLLVNICNRQHAPVSHDLRVIRLSEDGTGKVSQLMKRRHQPKQLPATSPDSAFVCMFDDQSTTLKVHDARTGRVVLSQPLWQFRDARGKSSCLSWTPGSAGIRTDAAWL